MNDATDMDLLYTADLVNAAAQRLAASGRGWCGGSKVFVADVAREIGAADLASFKAELAACQRAGLVRLSRADLVEAMPAESVEQSEIDYDGVTSWHFVRAA